MKRSGQKDSRRGAGRAASVAGQGSGPAGRRQLREGARPLAFRFNGIVGESAAMQRVYARAERASRTDATVLVLGESGTGKELTARAVHHNSSRADGPWLQAHTWFRVGIGRNTLLRRLRSPKPPVRSSE